MKESCKNGHICFRGTSFNEKDKEKCKKGNFCPDGTSSLLAANYCPRQTSSLLGSGNILNCHIQGVDVCDKKRVNPNDPSDFISYYPWTEYSFKDSINSKYAIESSSKLGVIGELEVLNKIIPIDIQNSSPFWNNETVELIRSCPSYLFQMDLTPRDKEKMILIIGRNFQNNSKLTCRYRYGKLIELRKAHFISQTRIKCPLLLSIINDTNLKLDSNNSKCHSKGGVDNDQLLLPCINKETSNTHCLNNPFMGTYLNPCYSSQLKIEISNNGKKFSGDRTIIPSTSDVDPIEENSRTNVEIHATWVMIPIIFYSDETFGKRDIKGMYHLLKNISTDIDNVCKREIALEEFIKPSESSWFQLPYMNQAHLSIGK